MEEKQNLKLRVQEESQKAKLTFERAVIFYDSLPRDSRCEIEQFMLMLMRTHKFSFRIPLHDEEWELQPNFIWHNFYLAKKSPKTGFSKFWNITEVNELYEALIEEQDWRELIDFIGNALNRVRDAFDDAFRAEIEKLDPDVVELARMLRETRENCQRLEKENNQLQLAEGYLQQSNESLKSAVGQSISQLQKVAQDLQNTRSFLGQSKTIKGIRENVEKVVVDLWKVAYPNTPPPLPDVIIKKGF